MSSRFETRLHLYAVVPADEASRLDYFPREFSVIACGKVAAVFGQLRTCQDDDTTASAAVGHDRIVGLAFEACSSVVPFRLGIALTSEAELDAFLSLNAGELCRQLARFRDRVEMGLKLRLTAATSDESLKLPFGLDRVRVLAPGQEDQCERLVGGSQGRNFEGCYLISRQDVEDFWRALDGIRCLAPELPLLGSGPWAAYSFCDVPLRRGGESPRAVSVSRREQTCSQ